jgi:hypothetical protein
MSSSGTSTSAGVALVTGAGSGIGKACAQALLEAVIVARVRPCQFVRPIGAIPIEAPVWLSRRKFYLGGRGRDRRV